MESFEQLWNLVCESFKNDDRYNDVAFSLWIACIKPIKFENNTAFVSVETEFQKGIIEKNYLSSIKTYLENVLGFPVDVNLSCDDLSPKVEIEKETKPSVTSTEEAVFYDENNYTFDSFVVGDSNKFANAACQAVASNPAGAYNPLFIYGNSGLGKTHLLYAICNEIKKNKPNANIIYIKCEKFTNDFISSIKNKTTYNFQEKYRAADILLVDDIQFLSDKERTQEEFFHTFNALYHSGRQIVLTSDRPPKEITTLEDRLKTRFESGLIADVQPPDFETRVAIIRRKAELLKIDIPNDVAQFLASKLKSNIRQIEGAVTKLTALITLGGVKPTINVVQSFIRDILNENQPAEVIVEKVIAEVSRTFSVSVQDIKSPKRTATISTARQVAIFIIKEITDLTMEEIGKFFGGKDHTTIVYTIQKVNKLKETDQPLRVMIEDIIKNVKEN